MEVSARRRNCSQAFGAAPGGTPAQIERRIVDTKPRLAKPETHVYCGDRFVLESHQYRDLLRGNSADGLPNSQEDEPRRRVAAPRSPGSRENEEDTS